MELDAIDTGGTVLNASAQYVELSTGQMLAPWTSTYAKELTAYDLELVGRGVLVSAAVDVTLHGFALADAREKERADMAAKARAAEAKLRLISAAVEMTPPCPAQTAPRTVGDLREEYAAGRIELEEFEERVAVALRLVTKD